MTLLVDRVKGHKFIDIAKDYLLFEKDVLDKITIGENKKFSNIAFQLTLWAVLAGVFSLKQGDTFYAGFNKRLIFFVIVSLALVPAFVMRNNVTAKERYLKWLKRAPLILLIVVLGIIIGLRLYWLWE